MDNVLEIENLTMDYLVGFWRKQPTRVLDGLSLSVHRGEIFGFLGHNGAGKTTTIKILMRIIYPTAGKALILGKPIEDVEMRKRIGYLPETPYFYDYLTGYELLDYFGKLFGIERVTRKKRIQTTLDLVGLADVGKKQLRGYSKGMLQRIGIAQAILNDPEVVFLDEPMSGLDPIGRREVRNIIASLRDQGKTVFFSTHILSDVEVLCDRVAILKNGKRVAYGRLDEVQGRDIGALEMVTTTVAATGVPALTPFATQLRQTASGLHLELKDADTLDQVIQLVRQHGGRIVSVNPVKTSLEEFFIKDDRHHH
ncbi:MAG: ABC transporter ATP-binding protein [Blastocatellia bacterium]|nr:ABC transporter ATP-binding protein [Blastocatellia bacterium]